MLLTDFRLPGASSNDDCRDESLGSVGANSISGLTFTDPSAKLNCSPLCKDLTDKIDIWC